VRAAGYGRGQSPPMPAAEYERGQSPLVRAAGRRCGRGQSPLSMQQACSNCFLLTGGIRYRFMLMSGIR
jgi:hypothetical protein